MIEKLKDIFYDLNDLLVTLIIILVIVLAIAYVFTNAFDLDLNRASVFDFFQDSPKDPTPPVATPEPETDEEETVTEPQSPTEGGIINVDPETTETSTEPAETATEPQGNSAVITMPAGGNLTDFAIEMQEKGVIKDYESFINLVASQGLDTAVQAGSYEFPLNITDAEAVRIMFGM